MVRATLLDCDDADCETSCKFVFSFPQSEWLNLYKTDPLEVRLDWMRLWLHRDVCRKSMNLLVVS